MRICIITPGALGSNPRAVKEAEAFHHAGNEVTVIATRTLSHVDSRDKAVLATAAWRAERLDFRARGFRSLHRGIQIAYACGFTLTGARAFADRALSAFTGPMTAAAKRVPADLYIAHYPGALPAAAIAARHHGARYAFDAEDFHLGDWPEVPAYQTKRAVVRAIEHHHLPACAYVTAASPGIADAYVATYGIRRPTVILNVFPRAQAPSEPTAAGTTTPGPSVYWFSQTIGPDRGLECAVRAIGRARTRPHLYIRGTPASGFVDLLETIAATAGTADRLHILAPAAPFEMERLAASYDVGFAGERGHTFNRQIALTNKQFTYLLGGLPIVMSDIPAHRTFAPEMGEAARLYTTDDADSLAIALDSLLGDPTTLAAARRTAFRLGQVRYNWDTEKNILLDISAGLQNQSAQKKKFENHIIV